MMNVDKIMEKIQTLIQSHNPFNSPAAKLTNINSEQHDDQVVVKRQQQHPHPITRRRGFNYLYLANINKSPIDDLLQKRGGGGGNGNIIHDLVTKFFISSSPLLWASINYNLDQFKLVESRKPAAAASSLSVEEIKRRLDDVPVYRLGSAKQFTVMLSDVNESTTLLYFLNKAYADAYSKCMRNTHPVTSVSLSEIVDVDIIKSDAVSSSSIRIVPDMSQIQNALAIQHQINNTNTNKHVVESLFHGVPIFHSDALRVMVEGHPNSYCPAFFNKADITKALRQVKELKHTKTQIQVTALEHIIEEMKEGSTNKWGDIFFIPPGNGQVLE